MVFSRYDLNGRVAVVSGEGQSMGKATALALVAAGAGLSPLAGGALAMNEGSTRSVAAARPNV